MRCLQPRNMMFYKLFLLVICFIFQPFLLAQSLSVESPLTQPLLEDAPKGALVITQSDWHSQNTQYLANPASLMKILTATLAADVLGPDFRFQTQFIYDPKAIDNGLLMSPLLLKMQGDPSFTQKDLHQLLLNLRKQGVTKLDKVDIDASRYQGHAWGIGQVWNDHGICFAAPTGAAMINRNCVFGNLKAGKLGQKARFYITPNSPLSVENQVQTLALEQAEQCQILLKVLGANHYRLTGCLAEDSKPLPLGFSGNDTNAFFAHILAQELALLGFGDGIKIRFITSASIPQKPQNSDQSIQAPVSNFKYVSHESDPLTKLVARMLKRSDNLIADSLFKASGYQYWHEGELAKTINVDAYRLGESALKALLSRYQLDTQSMVVRDGSGLSRENLLYAKTLYQVLEFWLTEDKYTWLVEALPIAAQSGTLKNRESLKHERLKGRVLAKSGSMQGVVNLAGFVQSEDKNKGLKLRPFVFIVNQFAKTKAVKPAKFSAEELQLFKFETGFLTQGLTLPESH